MTKSKEDTKNYKLGDKYTKRGGCPNCGSDLDVVSGCMVMCVNFQHPHLKDSYNRKGLRNCNYYLINLV
ncbi:MAG: hypothetical protein KQ78_01997 [Candidatus Izimaplasma bacterium HR2]|nr:MAG: hypothetical protein KQ78_01997 [Candidatus Izimaplasma bacterium HR2]